MAMASRPPLPAKRRSRSYSMDRAPIAHMPMSARLTPDGQEGQPPRGASLIIIPETDSDSDGSDDGSDHDNIFLNFGESSFEAPRSNLHHPEPFQHSAGNNLELRDLSTVTEVWDSSDGDDDDYESFFPDLDDNSLTASRLIARLSEPVHASAPVCTAKPECTDSITAINERISPHDDDSVFSDLDTISLTVLSCDARHSQPVQGSTPVFTDALELYDIKKWVSSDEDDDYDTIFPDLGNLRSISVHASCIISHHYAPVQESVQAHTINLDLLDLATVTGEQSNSHDDDCDASLSGMGNVFMTPSCSNLRCSESVQASVRGSGLDLQDLQIPTTERINYTDDDDDDYDAVFPDLGKLEKLTLSASCSIPRGSGSSRDSARLRKNSLDLNDLQAMDRVRISPNTSMKRISRDTDATQISPVIRYRSPRSRLADFEELIGNLRREVSLTSEQNFGGNTPPTGSELTNGLLLDMGADEKKIIGGA